MQKVGMTKKDIRQSINSQILIVFFAPLLLAGLHLLFAFPMISKLLLLFWAESDTVSGNGGTGMLSDVCSKVLYYRLQNDIRSLLSDCKCQ